MINLLFSDTFIRGVPYELENETFPLIVYSPAGILRVPIITIDSQGKFEHSVASLSLIAMFL